MILAAPARSAKAARSVTRGSLIVLGASIPISVALDNVLLTLLLASWYLAGYARETFQRVRVDLVALLPCIWIVLHALGALYSDGEEFEVARGIVKTATFLIIPIAVIAMRDPRDRRLAFYAFMGAIALTAILATLRWTGLVPADVPFLKTPGNSYVVVFKYHLTQNLLLAFGAFVFAVAATREKNVVVRIAFTACCVLSIVNVLFLGEGRTGQLVLFVLMLYFGAWRKGTRGLVVACAVAAGIGAVAYAIPGSTLHERTALVASEASEYQANTGSSNTTSTGRRLEYYEHSLQLFLQHPFAGVGTGGFSSAYRKQVDRTASQPTQNPHNEYLFQGVELGLPGIALTLALLAVPWRYATRLSDPAETALARGVVLTFLVASAVTSTISDHTEGMLYAWATGVLFAGMPVKARS